MRDPDPMDPSRSAFVALRRLFWNSNSMSLSLAIKQPGDKLNVVISDTSGMSGLSTAWPIKAFPHPESILQVFIGRHKLHGECDTFYDPTRVTVKGLDIVIFLSTMHEYYSRSDLPQSGFNRMASLSSDGFQIDVSVDLGWPGLGDDQKWLMGTGDGKYWICMLMMDLPDLWHRKWWIAMDQWGLMLYLKGWMCSH